jgi:peroxiredoxin Q/BCP
MLEAGQKAPSLKGVVQDGTTLALADLRGHPLVVYFYPKDNTSGCTSEAQAFRDLYARFRAQACQIVGVSRDSAAAHAKFRDKHALPFPLVADTDETWCNAVGVLGEKVLYGKRHIGVIRSTFLLDAQGAIVAIWRNVKVPGHAEAVLERLAHP